MAITMEQIQTKVVAEMFAEGYTTADRFTPTIISGYINDSLDIVWERLVIACENWFKFQEKTISVVSGTARYAVDEEVAVIHNVRKRTGSSAADYSYQEIRPLKDSHARFDSKGNDIIRARNYAPFWNEVEPGLDTSHNFVRYIEIIPTPSESYTLVYDGIRYIDKIDEPPSVPSTTYLELPENFRRVLVSLVKKFCYMADHVDVTYLEGQIERDFQSAIQVHTLGLDRDGSRKIVRRN